MRRIRVFLAIAGAAATLALSATSAYAHAPCAGGDGQSYGQDHIAAHTPHGPAGEHHNPGTHRGFSLCLGVHN